MYSFNQLNNIHSKTDDFFFKIKEMSQFDSRGVIICIQISLQIRKEAIFKREMISAERICCCLQNLH